ncbi:MAG: putative LPS assembly protein LptD [Ginsengibacter sp.]
MQIILKIFLKTLWQSSIFSLCLIFFANAQVTPRDSLKLHSDSTISTSSKKDHFSVAEKQKFRTDSANKNKNAIVVDSISLLSATSSKKKPIDSTFNPVDTTKFKLAKNALDAPVKYSAEDSAVMNLGEQVTITLYGTKAVTNYKDNELTAPVITYEQSTGDIIASIKRDSSGKVISLPTFKQADFTSQSDSIRFNMKSGKGITKSTYTQQGEMYVYAKVIKKVSDDVFYALRGRFTTCNLDTPHFAFVSNKIKFINNKVAISGPVHPEFEGVPIPIYFPFGIYPLSQGRHSGLLAPNFTTNEQRGLGLEGLGYYKVLSDNWDVILRTSVYSYGGYSLNVSPRYMKRYRYSGNFSLDMRHFNSNFKGDPDFFKDRSYHVSWNHTSDQKSRPGVNFFARVDAGSSSYNRLDPTNPSINFDNQLQSTISYSKQWKDKPFNLTIAATHNQNSNLKLINVSLPNAGFTITTIYPFRRKEFVGEPKWFENIGIGYNGTLENRFSFYDTVKSKSIFQQIRDTMRWGAHHSVPISLSLPPIGIFQISPGISYDETWFQTKSTRYYDFVKDTLYTKVQKGFYTARNMSFGLGISTRIFGLITSKRKGSIIQAIRHEMRPSININYHPDFNKRNYYYTVVDNTGRREKFSYYEQTYNIYGGYGSGTFGGLNFSLENNITAKVRNRKDTAANAVKKISILDALSFNGSYDFFADSVHRFSPISMNASTNLFGKVNVTASSTYSVYEVNSQGQLINKLVWRRKPLSLGRLMNANLSLSSQFQGGNKKTGAEGGVKPGYNNNRYDNQIPGETNEDLAYIRNNPGEFADFNIPWSVNFSYALTLNRVFYIERGFKNEVSQNISFNGTLNLTAKWQLGINGSYNISLGQLVPLSLSVSRDLHCWQMSINVSPVGYNRFFSINISPKSPLLRDLKINRSRQVFTGL